MALARKTVVLNGDLGSGKTTVSKLLAQRLGIRRISVGDLYRDMAAKRGLTALQLNIHAELDDKIDFFVDQLQRDIAASGEQLIVDSRLAWHFFTNAVKVHLVTEPSVAATRVLGRPANTVESYSSIEEARSRLANRSDSERSRFLTRYGVDKARLRNYDIVCDSTRATPDEIVERIIEVAAGGQEDGPACFLDPQRIYPTRKARGTGEVAVDYAAPHFFAVDGRDTLSEAIRDGMTLVRATLAAEENETTNGPTVEEYFASHVDADQLRDWEAGHGITLPR